MIWHLSLSERCAARREHFSAVIGTVMVMIRRIDQGTGLWLTVINGWELRSSHGELYLNRNRGGGRDGAKWLA